MRVLIFGDIFGRPGREAISHIAPKWKKEFLPDLILANGENLSHGKGISETTVHEMIAAGIDVITGGNHSLEGKDAGILLDDGNLPLLRPLNFIAGHPGRGYLRKKVGDTEVLIMNAISQSHMKLAYNSPWEAIEGVLKENELGPKTKVILLDWHAELTSEKKAMGWFLDGRVSAVFGTHTHTPTADEEILPRGTAFISDIGLTGAHNSIIGEAVEPRLGIMVRQSLALKPDVAVAPPYEVNAVLVEIDETTGTATQIRRLRQVLENLAPPF